MNDILGDDGFCSICHNKNHNAELQIIQNNQLTTAEFGFLNIPITIYVVTDLWPSNILELSSLEKHSCLIIAPRARSAPARR
jgi:hypothetical protein